MTRFQPVDDPLPMHLQVANSIRRAISRGDLKVGERLPLEELGKELGVSRMPVREALIRLEKEGLVIFHNRRGAEVAGITLDQVLDITNLRNLLESDALQRAFENYQPQDFEEARDVLAEAKRATDLDELADLHWRFHHCLYAPCNRPIQLEMIDMLHANVDRYFRMVWREAGLRSNWIDEHEEIVSMLEKGDIEQVLRSLENHMFGTLDRIKSYIEARNST